MLRRYVEFYTSSKKGPLRYIRNTKRNIGSKWIIWINRYRRKRPKLDASIFDTALSHTRRSDTSEKREKNSISTFGRFRLWTSLESSPLSVKVFKIHRSKVRLYSYCIKLFLRSYYSHSFTTRGGDNKNRGI